jgi:hypothetical protein
MNFRAHQPRLLRHDIFGRRVSALKQLIPSAEHRSGWSVWTDTHRVLDLNEAIHTGHNGTNNTFLCVRRITSSTVGADARLIWGVFDKVRPYQVGLGRGRGKC